MKPHQDFVGHNGLPQVRTYIPHTVPDYATQFVANQVRSEVVDSTSLKSVPGHPNEQRKMSVFEMLNTLKNLCSEVEKASQVDESPPRVPTISFDLDSRSIGQEVLRQYNEVIRRNETLTKDIETLDEENYTLWEKNKAITDENICLKLLLAQHAIPLEGAQSFHIPGASLQSGQATFQVSPVHASLHQTRPSDGQSIDNESIPFNTVPEDDRSKSTPTVIDDSRQVPGYDTAEDQRRNEPDVDEAISDFQHILSHDAARNQKGKELDDDEAVSDSQHNSGHDVARNQKRRTPDDDEATDKVVYAKLLKFVKESREGFRCRVPKCRKTFKEESAWRYHLRDAHSDWLANLMQEAHHTTNQVHSYERERWEHDRKRRVEIKVWELDDKLSDEGFNKSHIEAEKNALRTRLLMENDETQTEEWKVYQAQALSKQSEATPSSNDLPLEDHHGANIDSRSRYRNSSYQESSHAFASNDYNSMDWSPLRRTESVQQGPSRQSVGRAQKYGILDFDAPEEGHVPELDYGNEMEAKKLKKEATKIKKRALKIKKEIKTEESAEASRPKISFGFPKRSTADKGKGKS